VIGQGQGSLQGVTAASSGTHTHAGAESRRLAWRCLARPSADHRSYQRGAAEIPAGVSVTGLGVGGVKGRTCASLATSEAIPTSYCCIWPGERRPPSADIVTGGESYLRTKSSAQ